MTSHMTLELTLILGFLAHITGDYLVQNDWMALNKKKWTLTGELACNVHCMTYSLLFLPFTTWQGFVMIYLAHYVIDRFEAVDWFIAIKNGTWSTDNFGFSPARPTFVTLWLYIIADNTFHLLFNSLILWACLR